MRNWCYQIFQGLAYIHKHGFFHRDMKPGRVGALQGCNHGAAKWQTEAIGLRGAGRGPKGVGSRHEAR